MSDEVDIYPFPKDKSCIKFKKDTIKNKFISKYTLSFNIREIISK